ncbi:Scd6-like Sm domain-containing protein [Cantharellus anzutake]|uniref:Scd6-like Sm domain-containing protein n=1 Tax=Cantharellus anzutake TaxID=1750568 RepID=UPI0019045E9E|nr:Scd6-like Sm domain-containing protein [Cantharellus anzutake]KAF8329755.1 Scd6-like Sm domain-containing protein [Cantharellus anzutake]
MATSFINSPISLISVADIRYRGILTNIDHDAATLGLSNVYSMGTENRRPPAEYIPPQPMPYDYVVFRASEVQNLAVDTEARPQPRNIVNDPAVLGVSITYSLSRLPPHDEIFTDVISSESAKTHVELSVAFLLSHFHRSSTFVVVKLTCSRPQVPNAPSKPQQLPPQNGPSHVQSEAPPVTVHQPATTVKPSAPVPQPSPQPAPQPVLQPVPQPVSQPAPLPVPPVSSSRLPLDNSQSQTQSQPAPQEPRPQQPNPQPQTVPTRPRPPVDESGPVRSASTSLEAVEKALTDLRVSAQPLRTSHPVINGYRGQHPRRGGGGGRGRGYGGRGGAFPRVRIPQEDFDFVEANSKFDKAALYAAKSPLSVGTLAPSGADSADIPEPGQIMEEKKEPRKFYDKSRSFFDDFSSDANVKDIDARRGRGRGGRGMGRRDEERTKNLTTFGETGVNLGGGYWLGGRGGGRGGFRGRRRPYNAINQVSNVFPEA